MVNRVKTATVIGLNAYEVSVETDVTNSLPGMSVVGLQILQLQRHVIE
jgi:magnesium chelatase family protein